MNTNYTLPPINAAGKAVVRHFSITNPWLDFVVLVDPKDKETTESIVQKSMDEYWDSDCDAYGDLVESNLSNAGIEFSIVYHDSSDESDEYEEIWESLLDGIYRCARGVA